jgi:hypothetical protein
MGFGPRRERMPPSHCGASFSTCETTAGYAWFLRFGAFLDLGHRTKPVRCFGPARKVGQQPGCRHRHHQAAEQHQILHRVDDHRKAGDREFALKPEPLVHRNGQREEPRVHEAGFRRFAGADEIRGDEGRDDGQRDRSCQQVNGFSQLRLLRAGAKCRPADAPRSRSPRR